ncbi:MAG TPA: radical SAM protein [Polyangiaceae bacterium]|nr:radical SAM protein [Polyangiaceae bacterium]
MKLALVFAPYSHKRFEENIFVVDEDFGVFPPINVAYAAAIAERAGHTVRIFDANALTRLGRASEAAILREIGEFAPDAVGLYFSTYMFRDTLRWARSLKVILGCPVIAGGINCLLYPRETLAHPEIDYIVAGHATESLPRLLAALDGGGPIEKIPGVGSKVGGVLVVNPPSPESRVDFDAFPWPARHLLQNDLYYSFISQRRNFTIALTTLGCSYDCNFCAIAPLPRGARSPDNVIAEVREARERFQIREVDFFDANFLTPGARTGQLLEGLAAAPDDMEFSCRARVDNIDAHVASALRRARVRQVYLGIESSDPAILELLRKRVKPSSARTAVDLLRREGIRALGFFMIGSPGETLTTALRTILFAMSLGLDYAQFSRTIAKPNTPLHDRIVAVSGEDYWRDWVSGAAPERRMPSPWTELSEAQIELLTKLAYFMFYYRPGYLTRAIGRVRSGDELTRSARTAARMLLKSLYFD